MKDDTGKTTSRHGWGAMPQAVSETEHRNSSKRVQATSIARVTEMSSRSARLVAMERWRTETDRSHGVAKERTRQKEESVDGNTVGLRAHESVNVSSTDSTSDVIAWQNAE